MELNSYNPATGERVGAVSVTPPEQVAAVVGRARAAQPGWAALGLAGRRAAIEPAAKLFMDQSDALGALLTAEMGKPLREARGEVRSCGAGMESDLDEMVAALQPELLVDGSTQTTLFHDPYGVCAAITPWNFPISMPHWMVLPALMAGNSVVLKPSEETPLIAQAYVDLLAAQLPQGVLQIVHGADQQGRALVNAAVDLVAFTGSRAAGIDILGRASSSLKRVILELGGKDPLLVLEDADVAAAAQFAVRNGFRNAGQVCVSTERIYVHQAVAAEFEAALVEGVAGLQQGDGAQEGVQVGPMINVRQAEHVRGQIEAALDEGATLLAGGRGHRDNFVVPTVLAGLDHTMDIMRTETFGPVACVMRVADDEQAVRLANDSHYGLGAVVFGAEDHAARVARCLDAGMIGINRGVGGASGSPWVGAKQSGYGHHSGRAGHRQFAQVRIVSRPVS